MWGSWCLPLTVSIPFVTFHSDSAASSNDSKEQSSDVEAIRKARSGIGLGRRCPDG